jgi:hypothetical protein
VRFLDRQRANWIAPIVLILLPAILYAPLLFGREAVFWGTPLLQFWPWRQFAVDELLAGRLPLWNPYSGCGVPLLADHQTAVFYPPNLIYLVLPVERAMGVSLYLHAVLAGLAMYAFVRELGRSRLAGSVAGSAFMLGGYVVSRGSFLTEVSAIGWLPLLWLYGRRLLQPDQPWRRQVRALLALSATIALQFLAGHAQTWFYSLVSLALYGLWLVASTLGAPPLIPLPTSVGRKAGGEEEDTHPRRARGAEEDRHPRRAGGKEEDRRPHTAKARIFFPPVGIRRFGRPGTGGGWLYAIRNAIGRYLLLGAAVIWGIALAAIQFLPTMELSRLAQRSTGQSWETYALQYSMWPWRLLTLLLPNFFGSPAQGNYWGYATYWEDAGYLGVLPFALAGWAVLNWVRRRFRRASRDPLAPEAVPVFSLLALWSLLMALGSNTPVYLFFYRYVPGFGQFQAPARWLSVYSAAVAVLAGIGLDALRPSRALTYASRLGVVGGIQVTLLAGLATTKRAQALLTGAGLPDIRPTFARALFYFSLLATATLLLLLWQQRRFRTGSEEIPDRLVRPKTLAWQVALLLLVAGDLIYAGWGLNPGVDATLYTQPTETGAALTADGLHGRLYYPAEARQKVLFDQYLDFGDYRSHLHGAERLAYWQGLREALIPDLAMVEHLSSANTFEPLVESRLRRLLEALDEADPQIAQRTLGLMNVAYLFDPDPPASASVVHRSTSVTAYRNPDLRPRATIAHSALLAGSPDHALSLLLSPTFDPTTVILETPASPIPPSQIPPSSEPPIFLPSPPNQVTIQVTLAQPGYLVLMDTTYPGWRATVDGQAAKVERANFAFRALAMEAGTHEVTFMYRPGSLIAGTIVSSAALIALLLACVVNRWGRNRIEFDRHRTHL